MGDIGLQTPTDREITLSYIFDAPREEVFEAVLDPTVVPKWWGPKNMRTVVDKMDVKVGGEWRYVQYAEDGKEHGFHGVYREIDPPNRLVYTFEYEATPAM
jgi:uncharacterized protein YndB with AHSA1/START domain